jgi:hypothetical protein
MNTAANKVTRVPNGYWTDLTHQRVELKRLETKLGISTPTDWYKITYKQVIDIGGTMLLQQHERSLLKTLFTLYPDVQWEATRFVLQYRTFSLIRVRFSKTPNHYWKNTTNQLNTLKQIETNLGITTPTDWYNMKTVDVLSQGGKALLAQFQGSMVKMLKALYPNVEWNLKRYS